MDIEKVNHDKVKEDLELASEYRGLESLYRRFIEPTLDLSDIRFMNGEFIDIRLGIPIECRENVFSRMKKIRSKLRNINKFYHV